MLNAEGVRKSNRCSAAESVASSKVWGDKACKRVGGSAEPEGSNGTRILDMTWPVDEDAAFNRPSVPAE